MFQRLLAKPSTTTGLEALRDFTNGVTNAGGQHCWFFNNVDCRPVVLKLFAPAAHFATFPNFAAHLDQSAVLFGLY